MYPKMKSEINKQLGKRIQYLRKQKGLSQEKLAEALNIATTSLSYIETGRGFMTLNTLENMAKILEVEPYEIFQNISINSNEEMYNYLIKKLETLKNNTPKLKLLCDLFKILL